MSLAMTYLRIINANHHHRIRSNLLNSIKIPRRINRLHGTIMPPARRRPPHPLMLQLLHPRRAPLPHKPLLVVLASRRSLVHGRGRRLITGGLARPEARTIGIEPGRAEQGLAEGLLASALEGLRVGDDALGACVGVEDRVGDVVASSAGGDHVGCSSRLRVFV